MRCAWLIYGELDQATGGYVYDRLVVHGLRRLGHVVDVVSLEPGACDVGALANALQSGNYDAVIGDELCHPELAELFDRLRERASTSRPKLVLLVHHLAASEVAVSEVAGTAPMPTSEHQVLALADFVVTTSRTTRQQVARWVNAPVRVIVPGADRLRRAVRTPGSQARLLFVGTWTPRKGLLRLLGYLKELTDVEFALTVVGDPARDPAYAQVVRQTLEEVPGLAARTRVCGVVSDDELASIYASSDVLVLPSSYEGYGMVLSEALFAGVFVVAADVGATREVLGGYCLDEQRLDGQRRAALLPSDDPATWVHLLRQLVSNVRQLRDGASAATELPPWSDTVSTWHELLTAACQQG